ncbi:MarR family winged helix-turn-helix transcriptional regulator [Nocardioides insulae]|uniref:MarR family winged helix-turn-helix transcriptional regulator n=1 Tax=Nocardioides insulae TaxID=394734 RepID=UPI00041E11C5|nr:MarR family winged helix-turn-helix transcriptional regulator [Nocardioides insulae]
MIDDGTHADPGGPGLEPDLGRGLLALVRAYQEHVSPALGDLPHGPRGYQTLREVGYGAHPTQVSLARHLGVDRTVMTYLIDDLVEAGLVERRANPEDRRQRLVVLTARGRSEVDALCSRVVEAEDSLLGALTTKERGQLRRLVIKAAGALDDNR